MCVHVGSTYTTETVKSYAVWNWSRDDYKFTHPAWNDENLVFTLVDGKPARVNLNGGEPELIENLEALSYAGWTPVVIYGKRVKEEAIA